MKIYRVFCAFLTIVAALNAAEKKKSASAGGGVVPFEKLIVLLPDMAGWKRQEPRGETVRGKPPMTRVTADYDKGEGTLSFEMMDLVGSKEMLAQAREHTKPGFSEKRSDGYTKAITVRDFPGTEEWTPQAKNGFISVIVADRFAVKVTGSYVPDVATIRAAVEAIDLAALAALK